MKKTVKATKILSLAIAMLFVLSLAACGAAPDLEGNGGLEGIFGPANKDENNAVPEAPAEGDGELKNEAADDKVDGEEEGEKDAYVENPFVSTAQNNISTFSADVDTASYSYFRKLVNSGYNLKQLTGSTAFRTEEFINYFKYDVPSPQEDELFGVRSELTPCPWNNETLLLRLTLQAEQAIDAGGNNLVFLIDVSGSMASKDKLPLLKKAFSYLVGNLDGDDTVSIVTYSGREAVVLDGCNGLDDGAIMSAINNLSASGSTNGEAGLTMAYQVAEKHFKADGNNRIIMASDGDLNVGISSAEELTKYIEEKRAQGVYLSVLGFGTGNYKDSNMEALADNGNGVYYYIDGESEAEKVFGTDLLGTLYTVAEDVKLQLEFVTDKVDSYRLVGYENRVMANEDFDNDAKDAGEVGASHQVTVCYEIKLKENRSDKGSDFVTLRVRYKNPGESLSLLNEYKIGENDFSRESSDDQRFICAVIETCMIIRKSQYLGDITANKVRRELDSLDLTAPYKLEFRELIHTLMPESKTLPEDITEGAGECDRDSGMVSEGRLYFHGTKTKTEALLVDTKGSLTWLYCDDKSIFEDFDTGDFVRVGHGAIMESYPGQTYISQMALIKDGDISSFTDEEWDRLSDVFVGGLER